MTIVCDEHLTMPRKHAWPLRMTSERYARMRAVVCNPPDMTHELRV